MHLQWKAVIQAGRTTMFFNIWALLFFYFRNMYFWAKQDIE